MVVAETQEDDPDKNFEETDRLPALDLSLNLSNELGPYTPMEPKLGDILSGVDPVAYFNLLAPAYIRYTATGLFVIAILHTFSVGMFRRLAGKYPSGSIGENFFHLLGEVEVVFGLWSAVLIGFLFFSSGTPVTVSYLESLDFRESVFIFVILSMAATRPVLSLATRSVSFVSRLLPFPKKSGGTAFVLSALIIGPLLGSYITEPAAMTVTALLLAERLFSRAVSSRTKYIVLGTLFVNVSIGGVLTPYAAPPVLMVAGRWGWDAAFMLEHFGWKAGLAVAINASLAVWLCRNDLAEKNLMSASVAKTIAPTPLWLELLHMAFLAAVVVSAHHKVLFVGVFLLFLGVVAVTEEFQDTLKMKEGLLVAFFLAGLVVLGTLQRWWLEPLLTRFSDWPLFLGATAMTAVTDNAALTYLGAQVPDLASSTKYFLVAGAVAGGGLTVIANAPNPAGYSILQKYFGEEGISALGLFLAALTPTVIAVLLFGFLP